MKPARSKLLRTGKSRSGSLNEEPVEVYCRIKPSDEPSCITVINPTTVQLSSSDRSQFQYTFSKVFDEETTQKEVFDTVALPLVSNLISGKNGLLFTYGVTGSGKTFTMNGELHNGGIMPRCLDVIFNSIGDYQADRFVFAPDKANGFELQDKADVMKAHQNYARSIKTPRRKEIIPEMDGFYSRTPDNTKVDCVDTDNQYSIFITYIEIYNKKVFDLLDDGFDQITKKPQIKLMKEDNMANMYVQWVTEVEVKSPEEAFKFFYKGQKRKTMAHTILNEESSRSHSIFTIRLVQAPVDDDSAKYMTVSQLSLVDLAGSERMNRTKNIGQRVVEAGNINNSLMTLRKCLEILRENQKNGTNRMVPYRECKLTHLFKNYFDGEGKVCMIVCVNPRMEDYGENLQVLKFAEMTQEVQVPKPTPSKREIGVTPGRRKFLKKAAEAETVVKELNFYPEMDFNTIPPLPTYYLEDPEDETTLKKWLSCLQQRIDSRNSALIELEQRRYDLRSKIGENEKTIEELQEEIKDKDMKISRCALEKKKKAEKYVSKVMATKEKLTREMEAKVKREQEEFQNKMREQREKLRIVRDILNKDGIPNEGTIQGTPSAPYMSTNATPIPLPSQGTVSQSATPSQGHSSRRGPPVCNPRHRRSRSTGERWVDHRSAMPVPLDTVLQPSMKKRKSVTKLDAKDIVNSKTSKYCLTTQEQDTDGEVETKLYKGDVVPTTGGGVQVIFDDVELLKQMSPTSEAASRKRSFAEGVGGLTESRCAVSIEGHSKRSKS